MKLKNIKEVEEFRKVIHACAGDVYLKSQDGDVFNLKKIGRASCRERV